MKNKHDTLHNVQALCKESVEEGGERKHSDGEQCTVPALKYIAWVIEDDECLDLGTCCVAGETATGLPAEDA